TIGLSLHLDGGADREAVAQCGLAGEMDLDVLLEDDGAEVAAADAGRGAEVLAEDGARRALVAAAQLELDAVIPGGGAGDGADGDQGRRAQQYPLHRCAPLFPLRRRRAVLANPAGGYRPLA